MFTWRGLRPTSFDTWSSYAATPSDSLKSTQQPLAAFFPLGDFALIPNDNAGRSRSESRSFAHNAFEPFDSTTSAFSQYTIEFSTTSAFLCVARAASAGATFPSGPVSTACANAVAAADLSALGMLEAHESSNAKQSWSVAFCERLSSALHFRKRSVETYRQRTRLEKKSMRDKFGLR